MNSYRKKLLNTILYFAKNVKHANTTKIFKLLNFFDFEHFHQTGIPSIGLKYYTFKRGPVPQKFWLEIKDGNVPEDFKKFLGINKENYDKNDPDKIEYQFKAKIQPDMSVFSPREKQILRELVEIYGPYTASILSKASHERNKPWSIVIEKSGLNQEIDYLLAFGDNCNISKENASEDLKEHFKTLDDFKLNPA